MGDRQDIHEEHVLDHYEDPYHRGLLRDATHAHEGSNPLCGDKIHIDLKLSPNGEVVEAWFEGEGCVISQASASMMVEEIEGKSLEEVKAFTAEQMLDLFGPKLAPNRQKCCLLPWKVLLTALHSPIDEEDEDEADEGARFGGPSLGEES
ncbi:MAG: iron-sulfur cluster assembly scaffold protein [Planctomycetota bacterium]